MMKNKLLIGVCMVVISFTIVFVSGAIPTFEGAGAIASDTISTITVIPTPPAHIEDDILLVASWNHIGDIPTTSTPGWAEIASSDPGGHAAVWFWKRAPGSGTAGPTITAPSSSDTYALVYVIRGAITTETPYEDPTIYVAPSAQRNVLSSTIDTTGSDRLVIASAGINDNTDYSSGYPPAGWSAEDNKASTAGDDARFTVISKGEASATTVSQVQIGNLATGENLITLTLAFTTPSVGYTNKVINVTGGKVNGVESANIAKVNGA